MPAVAVSALAVNATGAEKAVVVGLMVLMPAGLGIWQQDSEPEVQSTLEGETAQLFEMLPGHSLRRIAACRLHSMW